MLLAKASQCLSVDDTFLYPTPESQLIQPRLLTDCKVRASSNQSTHSPQSPSQFRERRASFLLTISREFENLQTTKPAEYFSHFEEAQHVLNEMKQQRQAKLSLASGFEEGKLLSGISAANATARTRQNSPRGRLSPAKDLPLPPVKDKKAVVRQRNTQHLGLPSGTDPMVSSARQLPRKRIMSQRVAKGHTR